MSRIECAGAVRPLFRSMSESGDLFAIYEDGAACLLVLVDVLGHGASARTVAVRAGTWLDEHRGAPLPAMISGLHHCLVGTRGAVATVCKFEAETGILRYIGVGNISLRIVGRQSTSLVVSDGVLGYGALHVNVHEMKLYPGSTLILHSDGISTHFDILECPEILHKPAGELAEEILNRFGMKDDDASCIVMKYLP